MTKNPMSALKNVDTTVVIKAFKKMDESFSTLSTNQVFMQENQVEFEKYLKDITKSLNEVLVRLQKMELVLDKKC